MPKCTAPLALHNLFHIMFVFQARPALCADLPRLLLRLLFSHLARHPVYLVNAAIQPHLLQQ